MVTGVVNFVAQQVLINETRETLSKLKIDSKEYWVAFFSLAYEVERGKSRHDTIFSLSHAGLRGHYITPANNIDIIESILKKHNIEKKRFKAFAGKTCVENSHEPTVPLNARISAGNLTIDLLFYPSDNIIYPIDIEAVPWPKIPSTRALLKRAKKNLPNAAEEDWINLYNIHRLLHEDTNVKVYWGFNRIALCADHKNAATLEEWKKELRKNYLEKLVDDHYSLPRKFIGVDIKADIEEHYDPLDFVPEQKTLDYLLQETTSPQES